MHPNPGSHELEVGKNSHQYLDALDCLQRYRHSTVLGVLNLEGNSCAEDRIDLLKRVVERLGISRIEVLLADREFIGTQWFLFLIEQKIPFIIRVKQNSMVEIGENGKLPIGRLRKWLSRKKVVNHPINLWGLSLYVSIEKRKGAKEQMIVVSNFKFEDSLGMYRRRWEIETMFGCLKTRGFRMEDTHITDPDKIEKVVFVLAIAFCWAYRMGDIQDSDTGDRGQNSREKGEEPL